MNRSSNSRAILAVMAFVGAALGGGCGEAFRADAGAAGSTSDAGATAGADAGAGAGAGTGAGGAVSGAGSSSEAGAGTGAVGESGAPGSQDCESEEDCGAAPSACLHVACVDGACTTSPVAEDTPCDGGTCAADGRCLASTCDSGQQDGDESGVDCGGSCGLCPDGQGCGTEKDCLSGVCMAGKCQASACTDKVKNGTETGVDCGGGCPLLCGPGQGCKATADCAVAAGDRPESVRCVANVCVSTKPPSAGGGPLYWQDFVPARLVKSADSCGAADDVCLVGNGPAYQMYGLGTTGSARPLTKELLFNADGVVGGGSKLDGTWCLTRAGTNLSLADRGAFTAMAWVKSTRAVAPWESAIVGATGHYFLAVDANPKSQRLLAAIATAQSTAFDYRSSTATNEVVTGKWHHVAEVYDTTAAKMLQYVDAKLVNSSSVTGNVTSGSVAVYVGCRKDAAFGQFFIGSLDELAIYTRALSAAELLDYVKRTAP